MTKILYLSTYGFDDPNRATLPFVLAKGALEAGYDVEIVLTNDATTLMQDRVVWQMHGFGMPPLKELIEQLMDQGVKFHVYESVAKARGVTEEDLKHKSARFVTPKDIANLLMMADKVITI